jgi:hypothetical protein
MSGSKLVEIFRSLAEEKPMKTFIKKEKKFQNKNIKESVIIFARTGRYCEGNKIILQNQNIYEIILK